MKSSGRPWQRRMAKPIAYLWGASEVSSGNLLVSDRTLLLHCVCGTVDLLVVLSL